MAQGQISWGPPWWSCGTWLYKCMCNHGSWGVCQGGTVPLLWSWYCSHYQTLSMFLFTTQAHVIIVIWPSHLLPLHGGFHPVVVDQHDISYGRLTYSGHEAKVLPLDKSAVQGNRFIFSSVFPVGQSLCRVLKGPWAAGDTVQLPLLALKVRSYFICILHRFDLQSPATLLENCKISPSLLSPERWRAWWGSGERIPLKVQLSSIHVYRR